MSRPDRLIAEFFEEAEGAREIFDAIHAAVLNFGAAELRIDKGQVSFRRRIAFAWVWVPGRYLKGNRRPLVLTLGLRRRDPSPRWKQVVEPYPGRFVHHMEMTTPADVDGEVRALLAEAWSLAG